MLHIPSAVAASLPRVAGGLILFGVASLGVGLPSRTSPSLVALMLSEAIDLTSFLNYAVKVGTGGWGRGGGIARPPSGCR